MILALAAIYGTLAFTSNVLTTRFLADQWGRRKYVVFVVLYSLRSTFLIHVVNSLNIPFPLSNPKLTNLNAE
jgi:hypothetical protein